MKEVKLKKTRRFKKYKDFPKYSLVKERLSNVEGLALRVLDTLYGKMARTVCFNCDTLSDNTKVCPTCGTKPVDVKQAEEVNEEGYTKVSFSLNLDDDYNIDLYTIEEKTLFDRNISYKEIKDLVKPCNLESLEQTDFFTSVKNAYYYKLLNNQDYERSKLSSNIETKLNHLRTQQLNKEDFLLVKPLSEMENKTLLYRLSLLLYKHNIDLDSWLSINQTVFQTFLLTLLEYEEYNLSEWLTSEVSELSLKTRLNPEMFIILLITEIFKQTYNGSPINKDKLEVSVEELLVFNSINKEVIDLVNNLYEDNYFRTIYSLDNLAKIIKNFLSSYLDCNTYKDLSPLELKQVLIGLFDNKKLQDMKDMLDNKELKKLFKQLSFAIAEPNFDPYKFNFRKLTVEARNLNRNSLLIDASSGLIDIDNDLEDILEELKQLPQETILFYVKRILLSKSVDKGIIIKLKDYKHYLDRYNKNIDRKELLDNFYKDIKRV